MNEPFLWEAAKAGFGFIFTGLMVMGGYWCKSLSADIKELYNKSEENAKMINSLTTAAPLKDKIQDERWSGLHAQLSSQAKVQEHMARDLQALLHSKIRPNPS